MHVLFRSFLPLLFLLSCLVAGFAQSKQYAEDTAIPGEVIVRFDSEAAIADVLEDLGNALDAPVSLKRMLSPRLHIALLGFDPGRVNAPLIMDALLKRREVVAAQWSYPLEFRGLTPNDPLYDQQWTLERIGLPEVWEITTGGLTANGDTIVIAILDSGYDPSHEDLRDNVWFNRFEIPGDGIDNDGNGFVDDISGWNFSDSSPVHRLSSHGLAVAGIAGARGNNGIGVTGVNMQVRLMLFTTTRVTEAIAAYDYVAEQRRLYNESGGAQGAFVVATNASWGQPRTFCSQQPVWGAMYDQLGEVGILTAAGTVNSNENVDEVGDMPASCPSEYIIAVLNTTIEDKKHQGSGYGKTFIDLGVPGQNSHSLALNNNYGEFGFNSAAAPHLSGAIALLYSLPCESLGRAALQQPAQTALFIREAILKGVDLLPDLTGKTVTGGRLNVFKSMEEIRLQCEEDPGPLEIISLAPNPVDDFVRISYQAPDFESAYQLRIFDALGRTVYRRGIKPPRFGEKVVEVDVSRWPAGFYFVVLEHGQKLLTQRFVVY